MTVIVVLPYYDDYIIADAEISVLVPGWIQTQAGRFIGQRAEDAAPVLAAYKSLSAAPYRVAVIRSDKGIRLKFLDGNVKSIFLLHSRTVCNASHMNLTLYFKKESRWSKSNYILAQFTLDGKTQHFDLCFLCFNNCILYTAKGKTRHSYVSNRKLSLNLISSLWLPAFIKFRV